MLGGTFSNIPIQNELYVTMDQLDKYVILDSCVTQRINKNTSSQEIKINLDDYSLSFQNNIYEIAASEKNTKEGSFHVIEKWRYPYWKKNGKLYVPGDNNPIGIYLIILADLKQQQNIPVSIHEWPKPPFTSQEFSPGDHSKGCIRMQRPNLESVFENLEIGAKVVIER